MAGGALCIGLVIAVLMVLVMVEISYRLQFPDPHRAEFEAFNPDLEVGEGAHSTLLALGDSFTAGAKSWPRALQATLGEGWRVVNAGIGGTTITHAGLMARKRIRQFDPDVVVYQTYVGNDLLDLGHPSTTPGVGLARRAYWRLVDSGAFAPWYLNHRAAGLAAGRPFDPEEAAAAVAAPFSVDHYSPRDRWLSRLDPHHVERQVLLEGPSMVAAWRQYRRGLSLLVERCRVNEADLVILVVPHCIQVAPVYRERFAAMGARWSDAKLLVRSPTPFVTRVREALGDQSSIRIIDPLRAMQRAERGGVRLYSTNDPHLTPEGSRFLALEVAAAIRN
ncbi:MAG: GDSL-type esterase/lipase family protein [Acidobacteriota bacterium]